MTENYYLTEKTCRKCNLTKILLCFNDNKNICKACHNAKRLSDRRKLGAQDRKQARYRVFNIENNL